MHLPSWLPFVIAFWVIAFGIMRLRIAFKKPDDDEGKPNFRKGGYYARSSRSHLGFGVAYLLLGGMCIAMGFGYQIDFLVGCGQRNTTATTEVLPSTGTQLPVEVAE